MQPAGGSTIGAMVSEYRQCRRSPSTPISSTTGRKSRLALATCHLQHSRSDIMRNLLLNSLDSIIANRHQILSRNFLSCGHQWRNCDAHYGSGNTHGGKTLCRGTIRFHVSTLNYRLACDGRDGARSAYYHGDNVVYITPDCRYKAEYGY